MLDVLKDYWGPLMGAAGMFGGYVTGREQTKARIREVSEDLLVLQTRMGRLEDTLANQSVILAKISTDMEWIKERSKS